MLTFKFRKNRPLIITNIETNESIEIHVPKEYKNSSMEVNLVVSKKHRVTQRKPVETGSIKEVETDDFNYNK